MTVRYPRCEAHHLDIRYCDGCSPNEMSRSRAQQIREVLEQSPASRAELAEATGLGLGVIDRVTRWVHENNAYTPYSLVSPRGGRDARYILTMDSLERSAHCSAGASLVTGQVRRIVIDTLEPWMRREGTPESVVRAISGTIDHAMQTVETLLTEAVNSEVVQSPVPDDVSSLG
jgi:hypothetical protein